MNDALIAILSSMTAAELLLDAERQAERIRELGAPFNEVTPAQVLAALGTGRVKPESTCAVITPADPAADCTYSLSHFWNLELTGVGDNQYEGTATCVDCGYTEHLTVEIAQDYPGHVGAQWEIARMVGDFLFDDHYELLTELS